MDLDRSKAGSGMSTFKKCDRCGTEQKLADSTIASEHKIRLTQLSVGILEPPPPGGFPQDQLGMETADLCGDCREDLVRAMVSEFKSFMLEGVN